ncbi:MAG: FecR domain-containing protein [Candidatus Binataceae bacterium]
MHSYLKSPTVTEALCACALLLLISVLPASAQTQNAQIAQVKTVSGQVTIVRGDGKLPAKVGDALFEKDTIETGADGAVGITFIDNTVMSAGPNSEVVLEEFQFDSSNFKGSMLTDLRKGTLSMVSGDIAKSSPEAMKVKTPTAILGVRGTRFVIQAAGAGN